jgi:hypothetical protein
MEIPFTITVPRNATPGDRTGGIVNSLMGADPAAITVERRLGSRIHAPEPATRLARLRTESPRRQLDCPMGNSPRHWRVQSISGKVSL